MGILDKFKTMASAKQIAKYGQEVVNALCSSCKRRATNQQQKHQGDMKAGSLKFTDYCQDCQEMQKTLWGKHFGN